MDSEGNLGEIQLCSTPPGAGDCGQPGSSPRNLRNFSQEMGEDIMGILWKIMEYHGISIHEKVSGNIYIYMGIYHDYHGI